MLQLHPVKKENQVLPNRVIRPLFKIPSNPAKVICIKATPTSHLH
jgi:hypothetical protein